jgi:hypothetical protein
MPYSATDNATLSIRRSPITGVWASAGDVGGASHSMVRWVGWTDLAPWMGEEFGCWAERGCIGMGMCSRGMGMGMEQREAGVGVVGWRLGGIEVL